MPWLCYVEGQSPHSVKHGAAILQAMFARKHLPAAKKAIGGDGRAPVTLDDVAFLPFEQGPVEEQTIFLKDIPVDPASAPTNFYIPGRCLSKEHMLT